MIRYLSKRLLFMIPTLIGVALLTFFMLRVLPGDIVELKMSKDGANVSQELIDAERQRLGLDRPLPVQFADWMGGLATFDLGTSMWTGQPVSQEIGIRFGLTFQVAIMACVISVLVAVPLGTISALMPGSPIDYIIRIFTISGLAVPAFWLGMLFIMALIWLFNWTPPPVYTPFYVDPVANLSQLIWPALVVGFRYSAVVARMIRGSVIEVLREDYIRTARSKGVFEKMVVMRHAMPNAILPAITVVGLEFAYLIGGLVVTEQVFNLNGIGRLFVTAVSNHDFILVQALVLLIAVTFILVNLIVDVLYAVFDPRIRYG